MQQVHYTNRFSVVHVEGLNRSELFEGIELKLSSCSSEQEREQRIQAEQKKIIERLQKYIPDFVDSTAQPGDMQCPNIFSATYYDIPLERGQVSAKVEILDNLGEYLLGSGLLIDYDDKAKRKEIADLFNGKSGVVITADYHWKGNEKKGLQLGRFQNPPMWGFSNNDYSMAFRRVLNAFCQGIDLTEEVVCARNGFYTPLSYCDGTTEINALVRDVSLKAVRAADQPVGEFMAWMQKNAAQVNTVGELVRLSAHSYFAAQEHMQRAKAGKVTATLPATVKGMGDQYLKLAQIAAVELQPIINDRMKYLVH